MMLDLFDILIIIMILISLVPAFILIRNYIRTSFIDFLIFGLFFLFSALWLTFSSLEWWVYVANLENIRIVDNSPLDKAIYVAFLIFYFLSFMMIAIHGMRIGFDSIPKSVAMFFSAFLIIGIISSIMVRVSNIPVEANHLGVQFQSQCDSARGFLFAIGDIVIIGQCGYEHLINAFRFCSMGFGVYAYSRLELADQSKETVRIRNIFILAGILSLIIPLNRFLSIDNSIPSFLLIAYVSSLLGYLLVIYIILASPELLLLSHVQLLRAKTLFDRIQSNQVNKQDHTTLRSVISYIETLPKEFQAEIGYDG